MKKVLFFAVYLLFGLIVVKAQDLNFGVKGGVNFASITGDFTDDLNSRTSLHFGVVAEIGISEKFSFQPELLYSAQGAKYDDSDGYSGTTKLDYLNIPLIAKYYVAEGFSLEAGPQIGFLLSAKDEYESPGDSGEDDVKDFVKGIDFGINLGVGYKLEGGLNFGARYNLGLSNLNDYDMSDFEEIGSFDWKNGVFQISVGYFF
jgi:hypothetical protein